MLSLLRLTYISQPCEANDSESGFLLCHQKSMQLFSGSSNSFLVAGPLNPFPLSASNTSGSLSSFFLVHVSGQIAVRRGLSWVRTLPWISVSGPEVSNLFGRFTFWWSG